MATNAVEEAVSAELKKKHSDLIKAIKEKNENEVKRLLDEGIDPNFEDTEGMMPLTMALQKRDRDILYKLLEKGADPNFYNKRLETPLHLAILRANIQVDYDNIEILIKNGGDINKPFGQSKHNILVTILVREDTEALEFLLENGADPNVRNADGATPLILYSFDERDEDTYREIVEILINGGADINLVANNGFSALVTDIFNYHLGNANTLIEYGADLNILVGEQKYNIFHIMIIRYKDAFKNGKNIDYFTGMIYTFGKFISKNLIKPTKDGKTPFYLAAEHLPDLESIDFFYNEIVDEDIKNVADASGVTPIIACARKNPSLEVLKYLLEDKDIDKTEILRLANAGEFSAKVRELILDVLGPKALWKGWTKSDAEKFDTIFDEEKANDYACCPVCLKYVERSEACMYMKHNCWAEGGYYHKGLYEKYKNDEGKIFWCTICGRIALGHRHYELGLANGKLPDLFPGGNNFETDCRLTNHGGGLPEKLARFRRLREYALDVQEDIGKRPEKEVLDELVEETWNAPTQRKGVLKKIGVEKKWNIPASNFPANVATNNGPKNFPDVKRPAENAANPALQPVKHEPGEDAVDFNEEKPLVIQFRHRKADGTINNHENEYIGPDTLETHIRDTIPKFGEESFGMCWNYTGGCTARLYPEEVKEFIPADLYEAYRKKFNQKFQSGGRRVTRRGNKQRGGEASKHNIFVKAADAQCYVPTKRFTKTKKYRN